MQLISASIVVAVVLACQYESAVAAPSSAFDFWRKMDQQTQAKKQGVKETNLRGPERSQTFPTIKRGKNQVGDSESLTSKLAPKFQAAMGQQENQSPNTQQQSLPQVSKKQQQETPKKETPKKQQEAPKKQQEAPKKQQQAPKKQQQAPKKQQQAPKKQQQAPKKESPNAGRPLPPVPTSKPTQAPPPAPKPNSNVEAAPGAPKANGDLLSAIQKGKELKKVSSSKDKVSPPAPKSNKNAEAAPGTPKEDGDSLSKALFHRRQKIYVEDDEDDVPSGPVRRSQILKKARGGVVSDSEVDVMKPPPPPVAPKPNSDAKSAPSSPSMRGDLLSAIHKGKKLKKVQVQEKKEEKKEQEQDLAKVLTGNKDFKKFQNHAAKSSPARDPHEEQDMSSDDEWE